MWRLINYVNGVLIIFIIFQISKVSSKSANAQELAVMRALDETPLTKVSALTGTIAHLPCDITPPNPLDSPSLIIIYHGSTPVYSVDARDKRLTSAVHWKDKSKIGDRGKFIFKELTIEDENYLTNSQTKNLNSENDLRFEESIGRYFTSETSFKKLVHFNYKDGLFLKDIRVSDEGDYHCRVDFHESPTSNVRIRLSVIEPMTSLAIKDTRGLDLKGTIGPYTLGSTVRLICRVIGGHPKPKVIWTHEDQVIDDVTEDSIDSGNSVTNQLIINNITRDHLLMELTCTATNSNITKTLSQFVKLDLIFPPISTTILGNFTTMREGYSTELMCEVIGSRPPASITWWKNGNAAISTDIQMPPESNISRSSLRLTPQREDNGCVISCRAENPLIPRAVLEDSRKFIVYYAPYLNLRVGENLDIDDIEEGDDVYFECDVDANPKVDRVRWFKNADELHHNVPSGIIVSNQSLVLQRVTRTSSGQYTCQASNSQARRSSSYQQLSVKFLPLCAEDQQWVYGTSRKQGINITCGVDAHPSPTSFRWAFNSTSDLVDLPKNQTFYVQKSENYMKPDYTRTYNGLTYIPKTHLDFGTILCWAINDVGIQRDPCIYQVVPASPPEPVHNCSVWQNTTSAGTIFVVCQPGWDGGLVQSFHLEIFRLPGGHSSEIFTNEIEPIFTVNELSPGTEYRLSVIAINSNGISSSVSFNHFTPNDKAEEIYSAVAKVEKEDNDNMNHRSNGVPITIVLGIISGVVLSLILIATVIVFKLKLRQNQEERIISSRRDESIPNTDISEAEGETCSNIAQILHSEDSGFSNNKDPDVIIFRNDMNDRPELSHDYNMMPSSSSMCTRQNLSPYCSNEEKQMYTNPGEVGSSMRMGESSGRNAICYVQGNLPSNEIQKTDSDSPCMTHIMKRPSTSKLPSLILNPGNSPDATMQHSSIYNQKSSISNVIDFSELDHSISPLMLGGIKNTRTDTSDPQVFHSISTVYDSHVVSDVPVLPPVQYMDPQDQSVIYQPDMEKDRQESSV